MNLVPQIFSGLTNGSFFAIIGILLTLMAQLTRVVNFSQVAFGMFGGFVGLWLETGKNHLPVWLGAIIALVITAALSAIVGWIIATWLPNAQMAARSAVTVSSLLILVAVGAVLFGASHNNYKPLLPSVPISVPLGGTTLIITYNMIALILLSLAVVIVMQIVLKRTMFGVRLRAISDRQAAAELLGVNVKMLNVGIWAVSGAIISIAISFLPSTISNDYVSFSLLIIPGAAAALVGGFKNMWLALVGGLVIGVLQNIIASNPNPTIAGLKDWVVFILILVFLLWNQRKEVWDVAR
jgi:branched-chain amino acid transport system permease protein